MKRHLTTDAKFPRPVCDGPVGRTDLVVMDRTRVTCAGCLQESAPPERVVLYPTGPTGGAYAQMVEARGEMARMRREDRNA